MARLGWGAKELHHFNDQWRASDGSGPAYAVHFRRPAGQLAGEWTPRYMWDPWAVPALLEAAPDVKLMAMLRDPLARFRSGVRHAVKHRGHASADDVTDAFGRGLYAAQLEPVLAAVGPERLLVLQFEQCVREPDRMLARTFAFLGLEEHRVDGPGQRNEATTADVELSPAAVGAARQRYAADAARLAELFPDSVDLALWRGVG